MTETQTLLFRLPLEPVRLLRARHRIRDYLHEHAVEAETVEEVVIAIEEAMTNAVRHSGAREDLEISLWFDGDDLVAKVKDQGEGFDVDAFDPDHMPDPLATCGRGLFLIARLMDDLHLRCNGGLEVLAVKRDARRSAGADPQGERFESVILDAQAHRDARQRALLEEIEEAFCALDWEYRIAFANRAFERLMGQPRRELLGQVVWSVLPRLEQHPFGLAVKDAMELGKAVMLEYQSPQARRWWELRAYPTSSGISAYLRDIDLRKRKELERDASTRRAELVASTASSLLSADDPQRIVERLCRDVMEHLDCDVFFNFLADEQAGCLRLNAFAGIDQEEADSIGILEYGVAICGCAALEARRIVAEDIQRSDDTRADLVRSYGVQAYAAHPLMVRGEVIGTLSFGSRKRATFTPDELSVMRTVADQVAIAVDRKRTEEARRESEQRLRFHLENTPMAVVEWDRDFIVTRWAGEAERMFGWSASETIGKPIMDLQLIHPDDVPIVEQTMARLTDGANRQVVSSNRNISKEGRVLDCTWYNSVLQDDDGQIRSVLSLVLDQTERTQAVIATERHNLALRGVNAILDGALTAASEEDLGVVCLRVAEQLTESEFGFVGQIGDDGLLRTTAISDPGWAACAMPDQAGHRSTADFPIRGLYGRVLQDGETVLTNVPGEHPDSVGTPPGHPRLTAFLGVPLKDRGRTVGVLAMGNRDGGYGDEQRDALESIAPAVVEAFERKRADEALRERARLGESLNAIDAIIHSSLQSGDVLQAALREGAVAIGAETAALSLHDDEEGRFRIAYVHAFPSETVGTTQPDAVEPLGLLAMRSGRTVAVDDTQRDPRAIRHHMEAWNVRSVICAPLTVRASAIGVISYNYHRAAHRFTHAEVDFVTKLASSVSSAVENVRAYETERRIALTLQQSFQHPLPALSHLEVGLVEAPASEPGLIGGDFWDVFELPDGRVVVVVGDVAGKGIEAAGLTETVRSTVRAFAHVDALPSFVLRKTNELLLSRDPDGFFVTALVATVDTESGHVTLASAGHPGPVHLGPFSCSVVEVPYGPPLGTFPAEFASVHLQLTLEDCFVLYTDGVTEARRDGQLFGERRLVETIGGLRGSSAARVATGVREASEAFSRRLRDDIEVMALRLR